MKHKPTKLDPSRDVMVNSVRLPDGREVSWAEAFPRHKLPETIPCEDRCLAGEPAKAGHPGKQQS